MNCAGCYRELEVGDQYIQFTASEWAERTEGVEPLPDLDELFADIMGSGHGDKLVYCEDCIENTDTEGWMVDTVYGDEA